MAAGQGSVSASDCFLSGEGWVAARAAAALAGRQGGHRVGRDVVKRLRGVGDHGDPVALDRQRRDPIG